MAVSQVGTPVAAVNTSGSDLDITFTVPSGTTLLILTIGRWGDSAASTSVEDWVTTTEPFTLLTGGIIESAGGNMGLEVYGIVSPTAKANTITLTGTGWSSYAWVTATCFNGTVVTGVQDAAIIRATVDNQEKTSADTVFSSQGSSPNGLLVNGGSLGADKDPVSNDQTWPEIHEGDTLGGATGNSDGTYYQAFLANGAPSAVTVTYQIAYENAGWLIELVAAAGGPIITDVNTTETWLDGATGLVATGTDFV